MKQTAPHYLLFTQTNEPPEGQQPGGRWRFVLEEVGSTRRIDESSWEPGFRGERLELLAVVRGLECLEQPSLVTLVTPSRFVGRGIRSGLRQWKAHNWTWEELGQTHAVRHQDLWRRIDAALDIHQVSCRVWHFDPPHAMATKAGPESDAAADQQRSNQTALSFDVPESGQSASAVGIESAWYPQNRVRRRKRREPVCSGGVPIRSPASLNRQVRLRSRCWIASNHWGRGERMDTRSIRGRSFRDRNFRG